MFLKTQILKAIAFNKENKLPLSYWLLVALRFLLTLLPQRGYLHPDEFFQNVEIIAGDVFPIDVSKTWEFNPKFPIRNIFVPKLLLGPPLHLIRLFNPYAKAYLNINLFTPYYLLVVPRLFVCSLSLINDYCLLKICILYGQNFRNRLKIFATSYVILVYCCRSFSNTFEMIFFSILLWLVAECMANSDTVIYHDEFLKEKYRQANTPVEKVKIYKLRTHLPQHSLNRVLPIAVVTTVGIFNRPTFIAFALPPLFFWLHRGLGSTVIGFKDFHLRIFLLAICCIPTALLLILIDSGYYGYLTMADIESLKVSWDNWVVTPLNFVQYNLDNRNLKNHGLHPHWLHLLINMPLLFNVLGVMAFITFSINSYRFIRGQYGKLPRIQSITGLMLSSLALPLALLSLFPHQEARFIIPVLLPLVYLYGNYIYSNESDTCWIRRLKKFLFYSWFVINIFFTAFFGYIHQAGLYPFVTSLEKEIKASYGVQIHVITTHSYSIPTYLLHLDSTSKMWRDRATGRNYKLSQQTFIYKYGSLPVNDLMYKVDEVLSNAEMLLHEHKKQYRFYIASPCSMEKEIRAAASKYYYIKLVEETQYFPHFCSEAIPAFPHRREQLCLDDLHLRKNESHVLDLSFIERLSCYINRFCLKIYKVNIIHKWVEAT